MYQIKSQKGFTLTEILVAVAIMALGFMAVAEMEFLSLRQKQRAEIGTVATNVLQFVSDRDMAEVKRCHLLNATAYYEAQFGGVPNLAYCGGACPCDPLQSLTPNPNNGVANEATCAAIDGHDLDSTNVIFRTADAQCRADGAAILAANGSPFYVVKHATTTAPLLGGVATLRVTVTYAVKTPNQFSDTATDLESVSIRDSLVSQTYEVTTHTDNWNDYIAGAGWAAVRVPHIP